jgi:hypothetical protein
MKDALKSIMSERSKDFSAFEEQLAEVLQPVKPPDQFVRELRGKLIEELKSSAPGSRISTRNLVILILAGVLSVVLFIVAGIRLILSIFGGLTLLRKFRPTGGRSQGKDSADQESA